MKRYNLEGSQADRITYEKLAWDIGRSAFAAARGERGGMTLDSLALAHFSDTTNDRHEAMAIWAAGFAEGWQDAEQADELASLWTK